MEILTFIFGTALGTFVGITIGRQNPKGEVVVQPDGFYGNSVMEDPVLDFRKYRGRGRPRLIDYVPLSEIQEALNKAYNDLIDSRLNRFSNKKVKGVKK